jgi:hypothetical protein
MTRRLGFSLLALCAILPSSAQAAFLTGSIGFTAAAISVTAPAGDDITTGTTFTFATNPGSPGGPNVPFTQTTTANPTGSFMGVPTDTVVNSTNLDLSAPGGSYLTLTLGSGASQDSFIATALVSDATGVGSRTLNLTGLIAGPGFTTTPANFVLVFSQSGGAGDTISYGGTLSASVPEPGSMILMGMGLIGALGVSRRRLGRLSRLSA